MEKTKDALFFEKLDEMRVRCTLCPHFCILKNNQVGICGVRENKEGILHTLNYGKITAVYLDPIEKKPLYHYFPGSQVLSIGSFGCNLFCKFCQNWEIAHPEESQFRKEIMPSELLEKALEVENNIGIAYTYNEPIVFYEYTLESAKLAHKKGLKNIIVSNGYINTAPLLDLLPYIDAFNIDLKAFTEDFYRKITHSHISPVLQTLKSIYASGKWLEITNLVIPGLNDSPDDFKKLIDWIAENLSPNVPLHLSRYFPAYKVDIPKTPVNTLEELYDIAKTKLNFVYIGNIQTQNSNHTFCPKCHNKVIERNAYNTDTQKMTSDGKCKFCGEQIAITT
jgi:pyruvate formate lyase activating enzyme